LYFIIAARVLASGISPASGLGPGSISIMNRMVGSPLFGPRPPIEVERGRAEPTLRIDFPDNSIIFRPATDARGS
jgi:hypothetical protein